MHRNTRSARKHSGASAADPHHQAAASSSSFPPPPSQPQPSSSSTTTNPPPTTHQDARMSDAPPALAPPPIADDDICPICHLLLYRPVRTTCAHTLCQSCMAHWADVSAASAQMTLVPLSAADPLPDAHPGLLEARCPMCRTVTTAARDAVRERELRRMYPEAWAGRAGEEGEGRGGDVDGGHVDTVTVFVGNTHGLVEREADGDDGVGSWHEWTFFVRVSDVEVVEEVQILLHPTFRPSRVIRTAPPYQITRLGWGYFKIQAYIILKAGYSWLSEDAHAAPDGAEKGMLPLEWMLSFDGDGSMGRCRLKITNEALADGSEGSDEDSEWEE